MTILHIQLRFCGRYRFSNINYWGGHGFQGCNQTSIELFILLALDSELTFKSILRTFRRFQLIFKCVKGFLRLPT
ncbi:hypothetical protein JM49_19080 [Pseudomonas chlororaphis subsp. aurantiaca]|nr:hypothetical protein JM49_19080 [Pseudomonas chlororaphis subsp. aurantiaca]